MSSQTAADAADLVKEGAAHHGRKDFDKAERCYRQALVADPGNADANNLLGVLLAGKKRLGLAAHHLRLAVAARPAEASFRNNLGNALVSATEYPEAIRHLEEAVRLDPAYVEAHGNLGKAYGSTGRVDDARRQFERALALDPRYSRARLDLARMEKDAGNSDRAVAAFRRLLEAAPDDVSLLVSILGCLSPASGSPELGTAEEIYRTRLDRLSRRAQRQLLIGLGRAYDGMGRHEEAIDLIIRGKAIAPPPYDIERRVRWCRDMRELFTSRFFAERRDFGSPSEAPVFIVGMVRSGSSLIEQVLASHPAVSALGESPFLFKVARVAGIRHTENEIDAAKLRSFGAPEILELAQTYLRYIADRMGGAARATDKQLLNFQNLGLIRLLFPNARIIHTRRDPIDTCLSSFLIEFGNGNFFNSNLRDLGLFYREYVGLMDHWRAVASLRLLEVDYEDAVADLESVARRMIDFLGLPWDDRCLGFHATQRPVQTASHAQVREPVHMRSVGRWKRYGSRIDPLIEALGDLASSPTRQTILWVMRAAIVPLAIAAAFLSRDAHAHAGERAFVLLLPTGYYLVGGTLAVAASVALLTFLPAGKLNRLAAWRWRILELPFAPVAATSSASFAFLLFLVICGLTGSRDPLANPLPLTVWTLWWVGFTLLVAVVGNLWVFLNPWSGPCRLLLKLWGISPPLSYPPWLGCWPAVVAFFAFAWFELIYPAPDDPAVLALVVIAYWSLTFLAVVLFGEETWLGRAEPFSVLFRFFGGLSPLVFERIDATRRISCSLAIPGAALVGREPVPASCVVLILLALASVSFDGLSRTFWWLGLGGINPLEYPGRTVLMARNTFGLLLAWAVLASVFLLCAAARAGLAVFSIMPIALAYHFSHYLTALLVNGQYALHAFGLGAGHVTASFLSNRESVTVIWNLQAGSIVVGHILAVLLARLACARTGDTSRLAEFPLAAAMVLYTLFGLWLISTPVAA